MSTTRPIRSILFVNGHSQFHLALLKAALLCPLFIQRVGKENLMFMLAVHGDQVR